LREDSGVKGFIGVKGFPDEKEFPGEEGVHWQTANSGFLARASLAITFQVL
jgi:hypothetical protein